MVQSKKDTNSRPGWRGPGKSKPAKASPAPKKKDPPNLAAAPEPTLSAPLQQQILNIFKTAFPTLSEGSSEALKLLLQEIKQALFERDFDRAFGRQDYLEAYAFRWSPSRALCYATVLVDLQEHFSQILPRSFRGGDRVLGGGSEEMAAEGGEDVFNVTCIGGGAAEVVGFSGFLNHLLNTTPPISGASTRLNLHLNLIDLASWSPIITALLSTLTHPAPPSKYASATSLASNTPLLPPTTNLTLTSTQHNILTLPATDLPPLLPSPRGLITLLFTLNELYAHSAAQTTLFLTHLTACAQRGTCLLIIDSAGSYSAMQIGGRKYPMSWLLDFTLLRSSGVKTRDLEDREDGEKEAKWEKLVEEESCWFRISERGRERLRYPLPLEDMRYQVHLFRRV